MLRMTSLSLPLPLLLATRSRVASLARTRARKPASLVHVLLSIWLAVGVPEVSWPTTMTGDSSG